MRGCGVVQMNMPTKLNPKTNQSNRVFNIIEEIQAKSGDSDCIYRGEPEDTGTVSSSLYREFAHINAESFDLELVQRDILNEAKKHLYKTDEFDILTELQHYGGKTNLIDFTTDYLIALFFACDGALDKDGRVIVQKTETIKDWILNPRNPRHRVSVQKIVFVRPPQGFIKPHKSEIVTIPANLKQTLLQHLRTQHNISTETMFNDLYSFIRNQEIHRDAYIKFYSGFSFQNAGNQAQSTEEREAAYAEAVECYTKAIELKPGFLRCYINRGIVYSSVGEVDNAIEDYNTVIQLDPNYSDIYYHRGFAYLIKEDFDQAIDNFSKAIELNPAHAIAYYYRGIVYGLKGDFALAIKDLSKGIELNPEFPISYYSRGLAYEIKGEVDLAMQDYHKAIELNPGYAEVYYNRGNVYREKGKLNKAIKDFNTAIELKPDDVEAYNNRGIAYSNKGDHDRAIQDFDKAIELNPDFAEAYCNRGEAWLHLQEWEKAKEDLTTAKNIGADIIDSFRNDYENVAAFEQQHNVKLTKDIAAMLTPRRHSS